MQKAKKDTPHIEYFAAGPFPIYVGLALEEKAYFAELKRMGVKSPKPFILDAAAGATIHFFVPTDEEEKNQRTCIICLDAAATVRDKYDDCQIMSLFVHEVVHLWQECREAMREKEPGQEVEAYFIQYFSQRCMESFEEFRKNMRKKHGKRRARK